MLEIFDAVHYKPAVDVASGARFDNCGERDECQSVAVSICLWMCSERRSMSSLKSTQGLSLAPEQQSGERNTESSARDT